MSYEDMFVSNEDLIRQLRAGDDSALEQLCRNNIGLIKKKAWRLSCDYGANHVDEKGNLIEYTRVLLEDLESEGMTAFIACVTRGQYDPNAARMVTYVYRFIDGAMRRYLETNLHAVSYDRDTMTLARKAQALYFKHGYNMYELAVMLNVSPSRAVACLNICLYPDQSFDEFRYGHRSDEEEIEIDPLHLLPDTYLLSPPDIAVYHRMRDEFLSELLCILPEKERDVLGKSFGLRGYAEESTEDIAMFHMITEDAVLKTKKRALDCLRESYAGSKLELWEEINDYLKYTDRIKP